MHISLDALQVLDAIDRAGSFAAAAERLFRVPSAVSYTIHKLERDLGVQVFDRSGHRATLTRAGRQLLSDGRELLQLAEGVEHRARTAGAGDGGRLSIAVGDLLPRRAVYPLLRAFYDVPGHRATRLQILRDAPAGCWDTLVDGRTDLVIGAPEPLPNVDGVQARSLGEVALALVMPRAHPLAAVGEPIPAALLAHHRVVGRAAWPFSAPPAAGSDAEGMVTVGDYDSQLEAVRHGLGIGYVPASLVHRDGAAGGLVARALADAPRVRLAAAWRSTHSTREMDWFVDRLGNRTVCARLLAGAA